MGSRHRFGPFLVFAVELRVYGSAADGSRKRLVKLLELLLGERLVNQLADIGQKFLIAGDGAGLGHHDFGGQL